MPEQFGFCLVGCGMIARYHARAIAEIPGAKVAALVSRSADSARKLLDETKTPPCPVFATVAEAVKAPGVDAIVINPTSPVANVPVLEKAYDAGVAVIIVAADA